MTVWNRRIVFAVALAVCLVVPAIAYAGGVANDVAPGPGEAAWKAHDPSMGMIDFEDKADGFVLGEELPGVKFTTTDGFDWTVGAWSAGGYNGKYQNNGLPYTSEGDKWAWLGTQQGRGVITFTGGTAGYVSLYASCNSAVVLNAYDADGNLVDTSGYCTANTSTGTMAKLWVSRIQKDIAYVEVHDTGNYFDVDLLVTDAPGVGITCNEPKISDDLMAQHDFYTVPLQIKVHPALKVCYTPPADIPCLNPATHRSGQTTLTVEVWSNLPFYKTISVDGPIVYNEDRNKQELTSFEPPDFSEPVPWPEGKRLPGVTEAGVLDTINCPGGGFTKYRDMWATEDCEGNITWQNRGVWDDEMFPWLELPEGQDYIGPIGYGDIDHHIWREQMVWESPPINWCVTAGWYKANLKVDVYQN